MFKDIHMVQMHDFLRKKLKDGPTHVDRDEVEAVGGNMGLDPVEATQLFRSLRGACWQGECITVNEEKEWIGAWIESVR